MTRMRGAAGGNTRHLVTAHGHSIATTRVPLGASTGQMRNGPAAAGSAPAGINPTRGDGDNASASGGVVTGISRGASDAGTGGQGATAASSAQVTTATALGKGLTTGLAPAASSAAAVVALPPRAVAAIRTPVSAVERLTMAG